MTKKEIVRVIAEETGMTQAVVKEIVQKTFDCILDALARGDRVELRNFGVFDLKLRAARTARNLSTGEQVHVPERTVVAFKASREMEKRVASRDQDKRFTESGFMPDARSRLDLPSSSDDNGNQDSSD